MEPVLGEWKTAPDAANRGVLGKRYIFELLAQGWTTASANQSGVVQCLADRERERQRECTGRN